MYTDLPFGYYELLKLKSVIHPVLQYYVLYIIYKKKRLFNKINIIYYVFVIFRIYDWLFFGTQTDFKNLD